MTTVSYKLKPAASRRTQLIVVASIWTIVGTCLFGFGMKWLFESQTPWLIWLIVGAIFLGAAKGHFILRKTAKRHVRRIQERGDGTCIFGVFSVTSWLLVIVMMVGGRLLRSSGLPIEILGALYSAVGIALIAGSLVSWNALLHHSSSVD